MLRASFAALLIVIAVAACSPSRVVPAPSSGVESLGVEVVVERPHDATAYTEGLQLDSDKLYESTGLQGQSTLREVDPVNGDVKRLTQLEDEYFGEGIA